MIPSLAELLLTSHSNKMEKRSTDSGHTAVGPYHHPMTTTTSRFREHDEPIGNKPIHKTDVKHHEQSSAERGAKEMGLELGSERRKKLEKRLKLKLDLRFSILVVIYSELPDKDIADVFSLVRAVTSIHDDPADREELHR